MNVKWLFGLLLLGTGCGAASGALGPNGYRQSKVGYEVGYADAASKKFLPDDWALDNYAYDSGNGAWSEKTGDEYRAVRWLDEDGDGTVSNSEKNRESIFDLRFVNLRDNAVIWLKVHPLAFADSKRDLEVVLENYADGLAGAGLFEQSSLFGLRTDKARQYTTFTVSEKAGKLGPLAAMRGTIEIADVQKLRVDPTHRDSKAELVFAHIAYQAPLGHKPDSPKWPLSVKVSGSGDTKTTDYFETRTGLLVVGYYNDAARFDTHLDDFRNLLSRIHIPDNAIPEDNTAPTVHMQPNAAPSAPPADGVPAAPASPSAEPPAAPGPAASAEPVPPQPVPPATPSNR